MFNGRSLFSNSVLNIRKCILNIIFSVDSHLNKRNDIERKYEIIKKKQMKNFFTDFFNKNESTIHKELNVKFD